MADVVGISEAVKAVFAAAPEGARRRMVMLRAVIFEVAAAQEVGPLTETLKWGEPAWLTEASGAGTTLRMGWKPARPDHVGLFVNCQTDLVDRYRAEFPDVFEYDGNRAVWVPVDGDVPEVPLRWVVAQALTYHRDKRAVRRVG